MSENIGKCEICRQVVGLYGHGKDCPKGPGYMDYRERVNPTWRVDKITSQRDNIALHVLPLLVQRGDTDAETDAADAYAIADAMMAESQKVPAAEADAVSSPAPGTVAWLRWAEGDLVAKVEAEVREQCAQVAVLHKATEDTREAVRANLMCQSIADNIRSMK